MLWHCNFRSISFLLQTTKERVQSTHIASKSIGHSVVRWQQITICDRCSSSKCWQIWYKQKSLFLQSSSSFFRSSRFAVAFHKLPKRVSRLTYLFFQTPFSVMLFCSSHKSLPYDFKVFILLQAHRLISMLILHCNSIVTPMSNQIYWRLLNYG